MFRKSKRMPRTCSATELMPEFWSTQCIETLFTMFNVKSLSKTLILWHCAAEVDLEIVLKVRNSLFLDNMGKKLQESDGNLKYEAWYYASHHTDCHHLSDLKF